MNDIRSIADLDYKYGLIIGIEPDVTLIRIKKQGDQ